jgi:hypothetical protein
MRQLLEDLSIGILDLESLEVKELLWYMKSGDDGPSDPESGMHFLLAYGMLAGMAAARRE